MLEGVSDADAAVAPPAILEHYDLELLAEEIGDNANAVTRFVLVSRTVAPPAPTGADKTSLIVELPEEYPGALLEMLEQFATRGINLSLLASRPIGDALGRYRFVIDADGHPGRAHGRRAAGPAPVQPEDDLSGLVSARRPRDRALSRALLG
jgi:prephenate dehydratase